MIRATPESIGPRAERLAAGLSDLEVVATVGVGRAEVGGGTLPKAVLASVTLDLAPQALNVADLGARLRRGTPPVIGYVAGGRFKLDLRTVFPSQDQALLDAIRSALIADGGAGIAGPETDAHATSASSLSPRDSEPAGRTKAAGQPPTAQAPGARARESAWRRGLRGVRSGHS
jgi:hypothetical protein